MLKDYIKIAIRTFGRPKTYTSINVIGLTLSIAFGLMISGCSSILLSL